MSGPMLVSVLGAECTGKSTLCEALAATLPGLWVREALALALRALRERASADAEGRTPRDHRDANQASGANPRPSSAVVRPSRG